VREPSNAGGLVEGAGPDADSSSGQGPSDYEATDASSEEPGLVLDAELVKSDKPAAAKAGPVVGASLGPGSRVRVEVVVLVVCINCLSYLYSLLEFVVLVARQLVHAPATFAPS
jgi:hypothetical protein